MDNTNNFFDITPSPLEKRGLRSAYSKCGLYMLILFGIMYGVSIIWSIVNLVSGLSDFDMETNYYGFYDIMAGYLSVTLGIIICIPIGKGMFKVNFKDLFRTDGFDKRFVVLSAMGFLLFHSLAMFIQIGIQGILDGNNLYVPSIEMTTEVSMRANILGLICGGILAPIFEETFFRGFMLSGLSRVSRPFGIMVSALFFGLFHQNIYQLFLGFLGGLWLGYITLRAGSIIPAVIAHFFSNTVIGILDVFSDTNEELANNLLTIWVFVEVVIGIVGLILFFKYYKNTIPKRTPYQRKRDLPMFLTSIPCLIATFGMLILVFTGIETRP